MQNKGCVSSRALRPPWNLRSLVRVMINSLPSLWRSNPPRDIVGSVCSISFGVCEIPHPCMSTPNGTQQGTIQSPVAIAGIHARTVTVAVYDMWSSSGDVRNLSAEKHERV
jgi:hypothetical protein